MKRGFVIACLWLSGCASKKDSVVMVSADTTAGITGIVRIRATFSNQGASDIRLFPMEVNNTLIVFPTTFSATLPAGRSGILDVAVEGLDTGDAVVANGASRITINKGTTTEIAITLQAGASPCGNGNPDPGEQCDDGNRSSGDGCSYTCEKEGSGDAGQDPVDTGHDTTTDQRERDIMMPSSDTGNATPDVSPDGPATTPDATPDAPAPSPDTPHDAPIPSPDTPLSNGAAYASGAQCQSGMCIDGVCCNTLCTGKCSACNVTGSQGTCKNIPAGADPDNECPSDPVATCDRDGLCDGNGACRAQYPTGTVCSTPACGAGTEASARTCDGAGTCQVANTRACAPYVCGATACKTTCASNADCTNATCMNGVCCAGCWEQGVCQPGNAATACGVQGATCQRCPYSCRTGYFGQCLNGAFGWAADPICRADGVCIEAVIPQACPLGCSRVSPPSCTPLNGCEP